MAKSDEFCDDLILLMKGEDRPAIYSLFVDKVLRPYLLIMDVDAPGSSATDVGDALSNLVATMLANFVARVVPTDDQEAAVETSQILIDAISASVATDIIEAYKPKSSASILDLNGNKLN